MCFIKFAMISAISYINSNTQYTPAFTSSKYRRAVQAFDDTFSYSQPQKIVKKIFNYSDSINSVRVEPYAGPMEKSAGISTEDGGYGGGWLKAPINMPLSTTDVHTCALLNLIDRDSLKQVFYHVFDETPVHKIEKFIRKIFPQFTDVNIVGGDQFKTVNTMRKIIDAVDNVNPYAKKTFYETVCENPQLVAYNGKIFYIKGKSGQVSFVQDTENYWY